MRDPTFTRWSGNVRIKVTLLPDYRYRCALRVLDAEGEAILRYAVHVNPPPQAGKLAVDSATAIDLVAHAALSFAQADGIRVVEHALETDKGWHIARRRATR